jgi:hypothetical protein
MAITAAYFCSAVVSEKKFSFCDGYHSGVFCSAVVSEKSFHLSRGASYMEKPRLVAPISAPCPQDSEARTLLERLEAENRKLRAVADELVLQIRAMCNPVSAL